MKSGVKKYNTAYKKRVLERDTYLPKKSPQESSIAAVVELSTIGVTGH